MESVGGSGVGGVPEIVGAESWLYWRGKTDQALQEIRTSQLDLRRDLQQAVRDRNDEVIRHEKDWHDRMIRRDAQWAQELKELAKAAAEERKEVSTRLRALERWRWVTIGAVALALPVAQWLLGKV